MNLEGQFLFFFSLIGVFNGFLLGLYCILFNKAKLLSRFLFGALILSMCLRNLKSVMVFFGQTVDNPWLLQLGESAYLFIGPLLLLFVIVNIDQLARLSSWMLMLLCLTGIVVTVIGITFPAADNYLMWRGTIREVNNYVLFLFLLLSGFILRWLFSKSFSSLSDFEKWTIIVFGANVITGIGYVFALLTGTYAIGPLVFSSAIYGLLIYFIWHFKDVNAMFQLQQKYAVIIDKQDAETLLKRLDKVVLGQQLYRNENLRIQDVAEALGVLKYQISQLLNDSAGKRFNQFINEYRINEACTLISQVSNYTLEGISREVGFRSKSTFFTAFKQMKGMTPNEFKSSLDKQK